ncbi:hypothetical protein IKG20_00655 [Candidatus Saccharibacteria bacterium]|nr:hypothetical protein [Candidatus Saccharibacteria bacterium]
MKDIGAGFKKIFREEKGILVMMLVLFALGTLLILHTLIHFKAGGTTMYIGYSDIGGFTGGDPLSLWSSGGYRTGGWTEMIVFPILGLVLGVLHNLFAIQAFKRRGRGFAMTILITSMLVAVGAFVLLLRLLGEI